MGDLFYRLDNILKGDTRFHEESYLFVMAALGRVLRGLEKPHHVSGQELLEGIKYEALDQFGPMAVCVFKHWGIKNSLDFGRIVFNMVREGILSKTETDALEDFRDAAFLKKLFDAAAAYRLRDEESLILKQQS